MGKRHGRRHNAKGRSEGSPRFIALEFWMLETPAWLALSANAKVCLLALTKRYNGSNNGQIGFGVRSGVLVQITGREWADRPFGLSRMQISRSLSELEVSGFIVCTKTFSFNQKRKVKEWRLTWLPSGTANQHLPTKDFLSPRSPEKQKPVPPVGQSSPLQSRQWDYEVNPISPSDAYSLTSGTIVQFHSPISGTHIGNQGYGDRADGEQINAA